MMQDRLDVGCLQRSGTSTPGIDVSQSAAIGRRSRRRAGDARTGGRAGVRALRPRRIVAAGSAEDPRSASMRRSLATESRNRQAASGKWQVAGNPMVDPASDAAVRSTLQPTIRRRQRDRGIMSMQRAIRRASPTPPGGASSDGKSRHGLYRRSWFGVLSSWFVVRGSRLAIAAKKHALPHAAHVSTDRPRTDRHRAARAVPSSCVPASSRAAAAHHHGPCHMRHGAKPACPAAAASRAPRPSRRSIGCADGISPKSRFFIRERRT